MCLAQMFTLEMFLLDISLILANVRLIGTQFIVRLYEPLLIFSSQKCTMKKKIRTGYSKISNFSIMILLLHIHI